jgi:hypothetical protein
MPGRDGEAGMMIGPARRWLRQQRHARWRRRDTAVLWPVVLYQTSGDIRAARNAFRLHISFDPAWRDLGEDERPPHHRRAALTARWRPVERLKAVASRASWATARGRWWRG